MSWARKKDANHNLVRDAFLRLDYSVLETYRAPDCPDLFVAKRGRVIAIEVKSGSNTLSEDQCKFRDRWQGEYYVVTDPASVAAIDARQVSQQPPAA